MMGQLPKERVTPGHVFSQVGVDYAGPLHLKIGSIRKPTIVKGYICIFVCLSVKAVHIDVVTDLTTEAFITCLRRFVSRRGTPSLIMSDNGTNFVGANSELRALYKLLEDQQNCLADFCSSQRITWKFIPERSPHFGGLWEASVKTAKSHLKRVTNTINFTYEELVTVLAQVEACMNSRPLTPMLSLDGEGVEPLTPGHFIIGRPITAIPECDTPDLPFTLLKRWKLCQQLVRHFLEEVAHRVPHLVE